MVKPTKFEIGVQVNADEGRVSVTGDIDMATATRLSDSVSEALTGGAKRVVVDLRGVGFIDSSGLRELIEISRRAGRDHWELALVRPGEDAFTVFRVSGADASLPFIEG